MIIYSDTFEIKTVKTAPQSAQFLFRVYHTPTQHYYNSNSLSSETQEMRNRAGLELSYTDYLVSLPENVVNFAEICSSYVFADAALITRGAVVCVVVFRVDEFPVDAATPVAVYHVWASGGGSKPYATRKSVYNRYLGGYFGYFGRRWYYDVSTVAGDDKTDNNFFQSYALYNKKMVGSSERQQNAFIVLSVGRAVNKGHAKLQFIKRAVEENDYFTTSKGNLSLNENSILYLMRFPLWSAALKLVRWQHTGFHIQSDGSVKPGTVAQSNRVANGVVYMAQQWRMFRRHKRELTGVWSLWQKTIQRLLIDLYRLQEYGYNANVIIKSADSRGAEVSATLPPFFYVKLCFERIAQFINTVAIAQGSPWLPLPLPQWDAATREAVYHDIRNSLSPNASEPFTPILQNNNTRNAEIFAELIARVYAGLATIFAFERNLNVWDFDTPNGGFNVNTFTQTQAEDQAVYYNNLSRDWPSVQADLFRTASLLFLWQLTFSPHEPTRAAAATGASRSHPVRPTPEQRMRVLPIHKEQDTTLPTLDGRVAADLPECAAFTSWPLYLFDIFQHAEKQELSDNPRALATKAFLDSIQAADDARKAERIARRQLEIDALRADFIAHDVPNPNDPYDYRNWVGIGPYFQGLHEPVNAEFVLRALDVPDKWQIAQAVLGDYIKIGGYQLQIEKTADYLTNILAKPKTVPKPGTPRQMIVRYIVDKGKEYLEERLSDYQADTLRNSTELVTDKTVTYSDRQIWPPNP